MKKWKRRILLFLCCVVSIVCACDTENRVQEDKITIVCTNFPLYDWTRTLLRESEAEVILLLNNGTDMHSFQPSAEEMIQIADCDLLVHIGGESDSWLIDALEAYPNDDRIVVNLMEVLKEDIHAEHYTEGMQVQHVHEDGTVCNGEQEHAENDVWYEDGHIHETETVSMDEHIWLSLRLAVKSCNAIEEALCRLLPEEAEVIEANSEAYQGELVSLDQKYVDMVMHNDSTDVVLVADRFPFMYMMEDYGIEYYAAFPGCSTESEADFETVVFLAEKVTEYQTEVIFITESGTDVLAQTIATNAGKGTIEVATLHSMQVVYQSDVESGCSYIGYMEDNLEALQSSF